MREFQAAKVKPPGFQKSAVHFERFFDFPAMGANWGVAYLESMAGFERRTFVDRLLFAGLPTSLRKRFLKPIERCRSSTDCRPIAITTFQSI